MEVKPGYEQNEVMAMPADWNALSLGSLARGIYRGASPRPIDSPIWFHDSSPIGWVRISDVTQSRRYLFDTTQRLSPRGVRNSRFVPSGSLIMSIAATVGRPIETRIDVCIHDGFVVFDGPRANQGFLYYVLKDLEPRWSRKGQTGSQMNLNTGLVKGTLVPIPPTKAEQEAIAEALSDADALIESMEQLLAKKRQMKQGAVQELLTGKKRLPGFSGEWEVKRFCDIADKTIPWSIGGGPFGSNLKASDYVPEGVRIIQLQNIGDGRFHDYYAIYTSEEKADELLSNNIFPGEIILSKMGDPVARCCFVPSADRRYLMASDGIRLAVDPGRFDKRFVHDYINSVYFRKKAIEASTGSTRQRIGLTDLKQLPFVAPPLPEQTAIAAILSDMDVEISSLEAQLAKAHHLKQGMMQELLTGRIRLA